MLDIKVTRKINKPSPRIETMPVIGNLMEIPMKRALEKLYPELLNDMAVFVETGQPSDRKQHELATST